MTILEALKQLRDDLKLWVTNNLRVKLNKNLGTEESGKYLTIDTDGEIVADDIGATKDELGYLSGVTSNVQTQLDGKSDIGHTHTVSNITDLTASATELNYMDGVTSSVQTQIDNKADVNHTHEQYLTAIPDEYITETELDGKGYLTSIPSEYITETELDAKGYLTEHQDLSDYAKTSDINTTLESYYTKTDIDNKGYAVATDVANTYAVKTDVNTALASKVDTTTYETDKSTFATKTDISDMATTSYVVEQLTTKASTSHTHTVSDITDLTATATELNYMDGVTSNVQTQLDNKVDKEDGKGLSTNDFTNEEKDKLSNVYTKEEIDAKFAALPTYEVYNGEAVIS